jgi:hypothetical protein
MKQMSLVRIPLPLLCGHVKKKEGGGGGLIPPELFGGNFYYFAIMRPNFKK